MSDTIKLTLRLPAWMHQQLQQYAQTEHQSLNNVVLETLKSGLNQKITYPEREDEKIKRMLRESKLWEPLGPDWPQVEDPGYTHEEIREMLTGVPPLSNVIIEDREPR